MIFHSSVKIPEGTVRICLGRSLVQQSKVWGDNIIGAGKMLYQSKSQKPYTQLAAIPHRDTGHPLPYNHWFNDLYVYGKYIYIYIYIYICLR